ncbi:family 43 glycosylhydrolase [Streptomyces chartreusis]|uniref:family 43 glycosylhydrolase n=1 Tax=Streptomyces chartreusis TaxID=1969 RepID=UPI003655C40A
MPVRSTGFVAKCWAALLSGGLLAMLSPSTAVALPEYSTAEAGNPFVDGWYADPDIAIYDGKYWVFPTASKPYAEQTHLDAFSSTDLIHWTKHSNVLTTADITWAKYAVWAPAPVERDGKYYLYFAANDIQNNSQLGGIGVAVADRPEGPYKDALGKPLISQFHNGAQPIDQDVFIDDDGQAYMYYGGWHHNNVVKLNPDMTSLGTFDDGSTYKEITPENYVEGSYMFKRNGKYYLMWSEGGWTGPDYSVSYAMSDSPTGPFQKIDKVLAQDPAVAKGSGHKTYGGTWSVAGGRYRVGRDLGAKSLLDTNFADFTYDADVTVNSGAGDAGLTFRVTKPSVGPDSYSGYYAGISPSGKVVLGRANGSWTELGTARTSVAPGSTHRMRVTAVGSSIKVFVDDMKTPKISVSDGTYASGANGLRVFNTAASFDNVAIGSAQ